MAGATPSTPSMGLDDLARFPRAVLAYRDADGYPVNVPVAAEVRASRERIRVELPEWPDLEAPLDEGVDVTLLFSSVRPRPGQGYDQRRYVTVWGTVRTYRGAIEVEPRRTHGWDEERLPFFELCERRVPRGLAYMRRLEQERGEPVRPRLSRGWLFFTSTRVPFLSATIIPVLLGAMVARSHGASAWWWVMLALLGASAIHLGLNVANDVFDTESGTDEANVTPTPFSGGSRVIQHGLVGIAGMRRLAAVLYGIGIAVGLVLTATRGLPVLWLGLAGVALSWFYTAPPIKLVHRGLGDIAVAAGFGPVIVLGTEYVAAQELTGEALYVSIPVGLLTALILYVNQVPDRHADAVAGKRTLAVRWSPAAIVHGYDAAVVVALGLVFVGAFGNLVPMGTVLSLFSASLAVQVHRSLRAHYDEPYTLMGAMGRNILFHALVGLGLIAGYVLEIIL